VGNTPAAPETPRSETTFSFLGPSSFTTIDNPSPGTEYTEQTVNGDKQKEPTLSDIKEQEETIPFGDEDLYVSYSNLLDVMGIIKMDQHLLQAINVRSEHTLIYAMFQSQQVLYNLMESKMLFDFADNDH
jgi:hypothetical protein